MKTAKKFALNLWLASSLFFSASNGFSTSPEHPQPQIPPRQPHAPAKKWGAVKPATVSPPKRAIAEIDTSSRQIGTIRERGKMLEKNLGRPLDGGKPKNFGVTQSKGVASSQFNVNTNTKNIDTSSKQSGTIQQRGKKLEVDLGRPLDGGRPKDFGQGKIEGETLYTLKAQH